MNDLEQKMQRTALLAQVISGQRDSLANQNAKLQVELSIAQGALEEAQKEIAGLKAQQNQLKKD